MPDLIGKTKAQVEAELGPPHLITQWDSAAPASNLSGAALEAWRNAELHSIWVYPGQVVSFSVNGVVRQVGTNSDRYLRPRPPVA